MQTFKTSIFTLVRSALRPMMLLGALLAALPGACGGKVVIDQGEGGGGAGLTSSSSSTVSVSVTSTSVTVGQGGGPPGSCVSCAEFITGEQGTLCPDSQALFDELFFCICAEQCIPQCTSNVCSGGDANDDCSNCLSKLCQAELNQCANDI
jgi:hypothetical protein